ncbi:MAG: TonB family protein [Nitrospira sp.]|nr:TonB family protein [Nitrospira sp.]
MGHSVSLPNSSTGHVAASWLVSCLLHAGLAFAAILFVQRLQLAAHTEPFQWDVAVVATPSTSVKATPSAQPTAPPTPALRQSTPRAKAVRPIVEPVEPAATAESDPESYQNQPLHTERRPSSAAPSLSTEPPPDIVPQHLSATLPKQETSPIDHSTAPPDSQAPTDSSLDSLSPTVAPFASTNQLKLAKSDYGWLAVLMAQWIEDLNKRYPAMLRTEGVQGKVALTAILHEDGLLSDVRVVKSSGHAALDQVAVEDVTNGPPITLSRPLNRAQMPVRFSISYDLMKAR